MLACLSQYPTSRSRRNPTIRPPSKRMSKVMRRAFDHVTLTLGLEERSWLGGWLVDWLVGVHGFEHRYIKPTIVHGLVLSCAVLLRRLTRISEAVRRIS